MLGWTRSNLETTSEIEEWLTSPWLDHRGLTPDRGQGWTACFRGSTGRGAALLDGWTGASVANNGREQKNVSRRAVANINSFDSSLGEWRSDALIT